MNTETAPTAMETGQKLPTRQLQFQPQQSQPHQSQPQQSQPQQSQPQQFQYQPQVYSQPQLQPGAPSELDLNQMSLGYGRGRARGRGLGPVPAPGYGVPHSDQPWGPPSSSGRGMSWGRGSGSQTQDRRPPQDVGSSQDVRPSGFSRPIESTSGPMSAPTHSGPPEAKTPSDFARGRDAPSTSQPVYTQPKPQEKLTVSRPSIQYRMPEAIRRITVPARTIQVLTNYLPMAIKYLKVVSALFIFSLIPLHL